MIVENIAAGQVDFDTAVKHVAAIRQHYLDIHTDDAQILLEGLREFMRPPEETTEVLKMQELLSALKLSDSKGRRRFEWIVEFCGPPVSS
jgi:hypothetical protein